MIVYHLRIATCHYDTFHNSACHYETFQNVGPNLGKPSGVHAHRCAVRAGPSQGFLAAVLHSAGWCLSAAALRDGGQRLQFRESDFGVRPECVTRDAGHHAGHSRPAEDSECAGRDTRSRSRPSPLGGRAFWASPLCNIP